MLFDLDLSSCYSSLETSSFQYDNHTVSEIASTVFRNIYDGHFSKDSRIIQSIGVFASTIANDQDLMHKLGSSLHVGPTAKFGFKFLNDKRAEEKSKRIFVRCEVCLVPLKSLQIEDSGNKNPLLNWISHLKAKTHDLALMKIIKNNLPKDASDTMNAVEYFLENDNALLTEHPILSEYSEGDLKAEFIYNLDLNSEPSIHVSEDSISNADLINSNVKLSIFDKLRLKFPGDFYYRNENDADEQLFFCNHCHDLSKPFSALWGGCQLNAERHTNACAMKHLKKSIEEKYEGQFKFIYDRLFVDYVFILL
jgi:hypothetical protein